jgi:hypothetical protein
MIDDTQVITVRGYDLKTTEVLQFFGGTMTGE